MLASKLAWSARTPSKAYALDWFTRNGIAAPVTYLRSASTSAALGRQPDGGLIVPCGEVLGRAG